MDQSPAITAPPPLLRMFRGSTGAVFILLCAMYFILYVDRVNLSMAAPIIKTEFHLSNTQLGLVLSAFGYCYAAFQILGGFAGDRFGGRKTLTALLFLCAAGTFFTGLSAGIVSLFLARLLVGLGEAGTLPNGARVISAWVPVVRRGFALGFVLAAARLASALTPPIVVGLMYYIGWRGAFVVLGFVSLAWAITWRIYFRDNPKEHRGVTSAERATLPPYMPYGVSSVRIPWRKLCLRMLPVTVVYFCQAWTLWLYLSWMPTFFFQTYHLDLKHSALFSAGVFGAGVVGNTIGGLLTDMIYRRTGDVTKARRNTVVVGLSCSLICLIFVLFLRDLTPLTLALSGAFFFLQACDGALWSVPIDIAPKYAGVASGIMNTSAGVAAIISPVTFGAIADLSGSYRVPFIVSIMLLAVGVGLSFLIRPDIKFSEQLDEPALVDEPKLISL